MQITKNVYLLEKMKGSYVYLLTGQEPVLIDTGMKGKSHLLIQALDELGMSPKDIAHILLTHQDVDHIGNAKAIKEASNATLWSSVEDLPYIHGQKKGTGVRKVIQTLMKVDHPHVDQTYQIGQKIGGIEIVPAPGHTPGHVCLLYGDVLFAGDLIMTKSGKLSPSPSFLAWNKSILQRSIREVGKLRFDYICPAHGDPVRGHSLWDALM